MLRKTVALIVSCFFVLSGLSACAESSPDTAAGSSLSESKTEEPADNKSDRNNLMAEEPHEIPEELLRSGEMRGLSPEEIVADMKTGWNLGNTLDATGGTGRSSEISWGNPRTKKEMIDAVHDRGFDTVRIPVTWAGHLGDGPEYTIDPEWLDRVQEVVNYAIDDEMYVILDTHHEESWRIPNDANIDAVDEQHAAIWAQIAERFKDYGDKLIFEGMNEPRVKGSPDEWNGGTPAERKNIDRLNQTFIDTVRNTGGNNSERLLLLATYGNSCVPDAIESAVIPDDPNIAFSLHAYTPYAFTYNVNESWELFDWDGSHDDDIKYQFSDIKSKFLDNGIPVILTEYGAVNKDGHDEDVIRWLGVYLGYAKELGMPCIWWDNGVYTGDGERFGLFDRHKLSWFSDEKVDAIMEVYK